MINAERIEKMKRLSAEATEGNWHATLDDPYDRTYVIGAFGGGVTVIADVKGDSAAQFIAESRQFVPDIIAAYAEQAEEIAMLRKALEFYADRESWAFHANEYDVHDDRGMTARDALK